MTKQQVCLHGHNTKKKAHFHDHRVCGSRAIEYAMQVVLQWVVQSTQLELHPE